MILQRFENQLLIENHDPVHGLVHYIAFCLTNPVCWINRKMFVPIYYQATRIRKHHPTFSSILKPETSYSTLRSMTHDSRVIDLGFLAMACTQCLGPRNYLSEVVGGVVEELVPVENCILIPVPYQVHIVHKKF